MKTPSLTKMDTDSLRLGESKIIIISPIFYSIQVQLELPFDDLQVFEPIEYTKVINK